MNQPAPKPKTFYEKTIPELQDELVDMVAHGNYSFSPNNYAERIDFLYRKESGDSANRLGRLSIWAAAIAAAAATMSAIATAFNTFGHHEVPPPPPPPPLVITQTAPPPAPVTITQTVLPPPPPAPSHP